MSKIGNFIAIFTIDFKRSIARTLFLQSDRPAMFFLINFTVQNKIFCLVIDYAVADMTFKRTTVPEVKNRFK